jgi:hypothetical protein
MKIAVIDRGRVSRDAGFGCDGWHASDRGVKELPGTRWYGDPLPHEAKGEPWPRPATSSLPAPTGVEPWHRKRISLSRRIEPKLSCLIIGTEYEAAGNGSVKTNCRHLRLAGFRLSRSPSTTRKACR